jgi:glycosyltransferase involved in cell wall biosynthesis
MTRVAYLVSQYPAANHTAIAREIRALRSLGIEVTVMSIRDPDRNRDQLSSEERDESERTLYVKRAGMARAALALAALLVSNPAGYCRGLAYVLRLGSGKPKQTLLGLCYFVEAILVGQFMRREGLHHLHCHYSSTVGLLARRTFPITLSTTFHGPAEFADMQAFRMKDKIAASAFVCAVSKDGQRRLREEAGPRLSARIHQVYMGIDTQAFVPGPPRATPLPFEIISVGRLASVKQYDVLLRALQQLMNGGLPVRLRLVGDGPEGARLQRQAELFGVSRNVVFEGWCGEDRVRTLYAGADAFVLPSRDEGLPMVLMEAMAMEMPCVATAVAGVPELIRDGANGLLVRPGDANQLAAALTRLVQDQQLRCKLGAAARQRILEQHRVEAHANRLAQLFNQVASAN